MKCMLNKVLNTVKIPMEVISNNESSIRSISLQCLYVYMLFIGNKSTHCSLLLCCDKKNDNILQVFPSRSRIIALNVKFKLALLFTLTKSVC